jgi:transcriptional regulator NrdR family protein
MVIDTRLADNRFIRRRRVCIPCERRFTTHEFTVELEYTIPALEIEAELRAIARASERIIEHVKAAQSGDQDSNP